MWEATDKIYQMNVEREQEDARVYGEGGGKEKKYENQEEEYWDGTKNQRKNGGVSNARGNRKTMRRGIKIGKTEKGILQGKTIIGGMCEIGEKKQGGRM